MSPNIAESFQAAKAQGRAAFVPYVTGGFPDKETCLRVIDELSQSGADVIEVGIPFSDPLADGPTIQLSSKLALDAGATPEGMLELVREAAGRTQSALVVMTYYNPVLKMGLERFAARAAECGVAGVLVPDLPPEEADQWLEAARAHGLATIFMCSPGTPPERLKMIDSACQGFLYYVSMDGVTGSDLQLDEARMAAIGRVRDASSLPVAVGFGVAGPEQAGPLAQAADGVIVGSAFMKLLLDSPNADAGVKAVGELARSIMASLKQDG